MKSYNREDQAVQFGSSVGLLLGSLFGALVIQRPSAFIVFIGVQVVLLIRLVWKIRRATSPGQ
jgi:uncharacterized membrane protein YgaE (UPF0421/DUF939 family)